MDGCTDRKQQIQLTANLRVAKAEKSQRETELREQDALFQRRLADTEMAALRSQMNPHRSGAPVYFQLPQLS